MSQPLKIISYESLTFVLYRMMRTKCIYTLSIVFLNVNKQSTGFYCTIHLNGKMAENKVLLKSEKGTA